jgi:hypothetical protein
MSVFDHVWPPGAMIRRLSRRARIIGLLAVLWLVGFWYVRHLRDGTFQCCSIGDYVEPRNASRIAKVTVAANVLQNPLIDRALKTHQVQNALHGYPHYVANNQAVSELIEHDTQNRPQGAWTKPAYILSVLVAELQKPDFERMDWLLYVFTQLLGTFKLFLSWTDMTAAGSMQTRSS